jgi:hypothetical protein
MLWKKVLDSGIKRDYIYSSRTANLFVKFFTFPAHGNLISKVLGFKAAERRQLPIDPPKMVKRGSRYVADYL